MARPERDHDHRGCDRHVRAVPRGHQGPGRQDRDLDRQQASRHGSRSRTRPSPRTRTSPSTTTRRCSPARPTRSPRRWHEADGPGRRPERRVHQQPRGRHPGDADPDPHRRLRRLWVRLDAVHRASRSCSPSSSRCSWSRCRSRSCRSCVTTWRSTSTGRTWRSGWRTPDSACALAIFLLYNYISRAAARDHGVGVHRRRVALPDLLAADHAAVGAGARRVRDLPVPLGLERLPRRADLHRGEAGEPGRHPAAGRDRRARAATTGTC